MFLGIGFFEAPTVPPWVSNNANSGQTSISLPWTKPDDKPCPRGLNCLNALHGTTFVGRDKSYAQYVRNAMQELPNVMQSCSMQLCLIQQKLHCTIWALASLSIYGSALPSCCSLTLLTIKICSSNHQPPTIEWIAGRRCGCGVSPHRHMHQHRHTQRYAKQNADAQTQTWRTNAASCAQPNVDECKHSCIFCGTD